MPCHFANQPINQSTNQPINQSTNQPINQSTNQPINQSANQPISQSANQPISQSANQPINQSSGILFYQPTDQPTGMVAPVLMEARRSQPDTKRTTMEPTSRVHSVPYLQPSHYKTRCTHTDVAVLYYIRVLLISFYSSRVAPLIRVYSSISTHCYGNITVPMEDGRVPNSKATE